MASPAVSSGGREHTSKSLTLDPQGRVPTLKMYNKCCVFDVFHEVTTTAPGINLSLLWPVPGSQKRSMQSPRASEGPPSSIQMGPRSFTSEAGAACIPLGCSPPGGASDPGPLDEVKWFQNGAEIVTTECHLDPGASQVRPVPLVSLWGARLQAVRATLGRSTK